MTYTQRRLEELRELNKEMMFTSEEELPIIEDFLSTSILQAEQEMLKRVRGEIERLATCGDCNGTGIRECDKCERDSHKCSRCYETGEISIQKDTLLDNLGIKYARKK